MFSFVVILNGSNWSLCILHINSFFSAVHQPKNPILELLKNSLEAPLHFSKYGLMLMGMCLHLRLPQMCGEERTVFQELAVNTEQSTA